MVSIDGKKLICPHCEGESFKKGEAQLNTAWMTLLDLDWLNQSANVYICTQCGRIEWFLQPSEEAPDDRSEATSCMACGTAIPSGEDTCPKCSWSYKN